MEENKNGEPQRRLTSAERRALYQQRADEKSAAEAVRKNKRKIIVAAVALCAAAIIITGAVLLTLYIKNTVIPSSKYDDASALFDAGEYQKAYDIFSELGDFSDARERAALCALKYAQALAGKEDVITATAQTAPWFTLDKEKTGAIRFDHELYRGTDALVIPDVFDGVLVTALAPKAFNGADFLRSVTLPASVTLIDERAFSGCTALEEINLSAKLERIAQNAFFGCKKLAAISIPNGCTVIEPRAFNNCSALESVTLPSTLTEIGIYAFSNCDAIKTVNFDGTRERLLEICSPEGNESLLKEGNQK
jgi:hypothetical protein